MARQTAGNERFVEQMTRFFKRMMDMYIEETKVAELFSEAFVMWGKMTEAPTSLLKEKKITRL